MWLFLLVALLVGMTVPNDSDLSNMSADIQVRISGIKGEAYTLDRSDPPELSLEILLIGIVAESRDHEGLEGIAADVGIVGRVDCIPWC